MPKLYRLALILITLSPALHAQAFLPRGNVFLGYSYNHMDLDRVSLAT